MTPEEFELLIALLQRTPLSAGEALALRAMLEKVRPRPAEPTEAT